MRGTYVLWKGLHLLEAVVSKSIVVAAIVLTVAGAGVAQEIFSDAFEAGNRLES